MDESDSERFHIQDDGELSARLTDDELSAARWIAGL